MIEKNKCPRCKYVYEVSWDEDQDNDDYYDDEEDDDIYSGEEELEELYPEYCPFCGVHRIYGSEADDDFIDE